MVVVDNQTYSQHDEEIIICIFDTVEKHPNNDKYKSLNVTNLSKLFNNDTISFEILEKLGFYWKNNRLVLQYESIDLTIITKHIKYCQLKYRISSKLKNTVINLLKHHGSNSNNNCNTKNSNNMQNSKNSKDVGASIAELIDALPMSVLTKNADAIHKCAANNDFDGLKQLTSPMRKRHARDHEYCGNWMDEKQQEAAVGLMVVAAIDLENVLKNDGDIYNGDADIVEWLSRFNLSALIVNNLIEMIIERDLDLTNLDDRVYFSTIVVDRLLGFDAYNRLVRDVTLVDKVVFRCVDNKFVNSVAMQNFAYDLYIMLRRYKRISEFEERKKLFQQDAEQYVSRWMQFESESKHICKSLLSKNDQLQWKCYYCNFMNSNNMNQCVRCYKGVNPIWPARRNKSEIFCVTKPFGLIKWPYKEQQTIKRYTIQDKNFLRIITNWRSSIGDTDTYEIICHHKYKLSKLELEQIVGELAQLLRDTELAKLVELKTMMNVEGMTIYNVGCDVHLFQSKRLAQVHWQTNAMLQLTHNTTTFEPFPINRNHLPYVIEYRVDFEIEDIIKPEYQTVFKSSNLPPCQFMVKNKRPCNFLNKKDVQITGKQKLQKQILKHLSKYDHFEFFGKTKPTCPYHNNNSQCIHFENVLNDKHTGDDDNFDEYFEDYKHLYLYFHKPNDRAQNHDHGSSTLFEFATLNTFRNQQADLELYARQYNMSSYRNANYELLVLINEIFTNGFEEDLLSRDLHDDIDANFNCHQLVKNAINTYNGAPELNFGSIRKQLAKNYKIFDILDEKMNHERHKKMDCPLFEYQMLSLILYCNGKCNHSLCQSQRNGSFKAKWPCFDFGLSFAIAVLSSYEIHDENIYTGLANVFFDVSKLYCQGFGELVFYFKTNVSFTRDLRVAREFRGSEGLILGVNLQRAWINSIIETKNQNRACDVSWISKFPTEQEILLSRDVHLTVCPSKMRQIGKKQWIVCNRGDDDKVSFENMFLANNNVLN